MKRLSIVLLISLLVEIVSITAFSGLRGQGKSPQKTFDETQFPVVDEYTLKIQNNIERAKSESKAKRFRMAIPAVSDSPTMVLAGVRHWPEDFSALPVRESTAIVIGDVTEAKANLSEDRTAVYSDFKIKPVTVLKDNDKIGEELTATRYGGKVRFQDGNSLLVFQSGLGMPRVGRRYVFFLKETQDDADLLTAYELKNGKVLPIDSGTPNFNVYENVNEADFLKALQNKIESLSKLTLN
jgi:hypothetical protein